MEDQTRHQVRRGELGRTPAARSVRIEDGLNQIGREEALEERLEVPGSKRCRDQHPQLLPDP